MQKLRSFEKRILQSSHFSSRLEHAEGIFFFRTVASSLVVVAIKLFLGVSYDLIDYIGTQWTFEFVTQLLTCYILWKWGYSKAGEFYGISQAVACLSQVLVHGPHSFLVRFPVYTVFQFRPTNKFVIFALFSVVFVQLTLFPSTNKVLHLNPKDVSLLFVDSVIASVMMIPSQIFMQATLEFAKREEDYADKLTEEFGQRANFVRKVCHEIRTPFTSILGFLELLQSRSPLEKDITSQKCLENAISASHHLQKLLNNILTIENLKNGLPKTQFQTAELSGLLLKPLKSLLPVVKSLRVVATVKKGTPRELLTVEACFSQIISNLVQNSLKFTQNGSISITVSVEEYQWIEQRFSRFKKTTN